MCHVLCLDGITRLCFIRGKFRGRGKKDNLLTPGTWVLIGLREWENNTTSSTDGKPSQKCDLLEVYGDMDKERLRSTIHVDWTIFQDDKFGGGKVENDIEFTDEKTSEYIELIEKEMDKKKTEKSTVIVLNEEDEIDINDI